MPKWSTSCPDWADRLRAGKSIIPPPIFPERAEEALRVFRELKIVDAPGSPTFGEAGAQWVFDFVASVFGAYDVESGRRLIQEWFLCVPKKNSKSTLAAGVMMTAQILNWRQSAEFSILAPTIEVANNSFAPARDMVQRDDELDALLHVQTHVKTITHRESGAMLKVIAADSDTVGGKKGAGNLVDELWLFGKRPDAENMFREALGGLASRPEGFVIWLTTQSDEPPAGVFKQKLDYARDVRDGKIVDPQFVPIIYEFPPEMIEAKLHIVPANFGMVNPNIGFSVDRGYLERELTKAQHGDEGSLRGFLAKHLNVEIGLNLRGDRWAGADHWEGCGDGPKTLPELIQRSEVIVAGVDGGGLDDLLGFGAIGREIDTGRWLHWGKAWAHECVLERRKEIAPMLRDFERQGHLTIVPDDSEADVEELADLVEQLEESGLLDRIGVDQAGIGAVVDAIVDRGIDHDRIVGIPQGWRLVGAIKTAERKLAAKTLLHAGQPVMAFSVSNAKAEARGNAIVITKQIAGSAKIDPLMAFFDCVALMAMNPKPRGRRYQAFFV